MRQYGEHKLATSGELETTREAHARYFADFIFPVGEAAWHTADLDLMAAMDDDFENLRAAWGFHYERKDISGLQQLIDGMWHLDCLVLNHVATP